MSGERFLVDTNILVYAYDRTEYTKQGRSRQILDWLYRKGLGVLSTQVLGEFFSAVTRRLAEKMPAQDGYAIIKDYASSWKVLPMTVEIIRESARGVVEYQFSFYDAQIWATAKLNGIPEVLSEDFSHGRRIEGVEFRNPLLGPLPGEQTR
jgi:predicted nucleic acid-binding protein